MLTKFTGFGKQSKVAVDATAQAFNNVLDQDEIITPVISPDQVGQALHTESGNPVTEFSPAQAFIELADTRVTRPCWRNLLLETAFAVALSTGLTVGVYMRVEGEIQAATCNPKGNPHILGEDQ